MVASHSSTAVTLVKACLVPIALFNSRNFSEGCKQQRISTVPNILTLTLILFPQSLYTLDKIKRQSFNL